MSDTALSQIDTRLKHIFSAVLDVPLDQITADFSPQTCEKWDSLNQIHLVNAIEEEFGFTMDFEDQMQLLSYTASLEIVGRHSH